VYLTNTPAVLMAVAAACGGPLSLHVPAGAFLISETLNLCSGLHLWGESVESSRFLKDNAGPALSISGVRDLVLEHLAVAGGRGMDGTSDGIPVTGAFAVSLHNVLVQGLAGNGVAIANSVHVRIAESKLSGNRGAGLTSASGTTLTVEHWYLSANGGNAMAVTTQNSRYTTTVFEENGGYGAVVGGSGLFLGNYFEQNTQKALRVTGSSYLIAGNLIFSEMELIDASANTIEANHFGSVQEGQNQILLDGNSNDNWIGTNTATAILNLGARNTFAAIREGAPRRH
jgi:hypothetical protein